MLAALRPRMLALAAEKARGAHPYFVPPEHTARAREILGQGPWLCPEQMVLRETDPAKARDDRAQEHGDLPGAAQLPEQPEVARLRGRRLPGRRQRPAGRRHRRVGRREGDPGADPGPLGRRRRPRVHPAASEPTARRARTCALLEALAPGAELGATVARLRKFWGWGLEGEGPSDAQAAAIGQALGQRFGVHGLRDRPAAAHRGRRAAGAAGGAARPPRRAVLARRPSTAPPTPTASPTATPCAARAGEFGPRPTWSPSRADESDVAALLDWCSDARVAAIPYGGGSSVVGGVEARVVRRLPRRRLDRPRAASTRVLEIDRTSRAARIQAGIYGPALEDALRPHGLTLRHFPQSFEFSTLGGWIATRSGGHYATLYTHIDDFVESLRVVTPTGVDREPAPARLGRRAPAPTGCSSAPRGRSASSPRRGCGCRTARASGPRPSVTLPRRRRLPARRPGRCGRCRRAACTRRTAGCSSPCEALTAGAGAGDAAILVLGFESADHPLDAWMQRALELLPRRRRRGARRAPDATRSDAGATREGAAGAWRQAFLDAPYLRDVLVRAGRDLRDLRDRDHLGPLRGVPRRGHAAPREDAVQRVCGAGSVTCRFTHVYPDGAGALLHRARPRGGAAASSRSGRRSRPRPARR